MSANRSRSAAGSVVGRSSAPPRTRWGRTQASARGGVLLETAIAIPVLLGVTFALAWGLSLGTRSMALGDAARQAARDIARGVSSADAIAAAQRAAPGAVLRLEASGELVTIVAAEDVSAPGPILDGLTVSLSQRVAVPREWS